MSQFTSFCRTLGKVVLEIERFKLTPEDKIKVLYFGFSQRL